METRCSQSFRGFAVNNDGSSKAGYTAPSVSGQAEVIAAAQAMAGFAPETITYVEAHGTGTPLGDPVEVSGLTRAFASGTDKREFCVLGNGEGQCRPSRRGLGRGRADQDSAADAAS